MLVIERETEGGPARRAAQDGVVAVAGGEHHLGEGAEAAWRGPVAARVEVGVEEEDVELGLVLDRALDPAELVLEIGGRAWDGLLGDLRIYEMHKYPVVNGRGRGGRGDTLRIFAASSPPVMMVPRI